MKVLACREVGFDCGYIINGETEEEVIRNATQHAWDYHAVKPEEMTSEMKVKIYEHIQSS